ncbi:DUF4479 domain-containing protein [Terrilactibacillus sp. BCM23-1]|uniref:DUF4479 domain-containing protein n=1 Tax=Terrilactibacillus tamarindi TaxID=2599694 RepID=A0A6N8CS66_9BACI|nr:DUF4479 family protein [Terrilactibacillus tamarindi]MTT32530.1 DUF4479 domain-containing protein [Terrilactibacillus tamarindi]
MNIFYNKEGIGDVLIVQAVIGNAGPIQVEKKESVVKLLNPETGETLGFNLFQISERIDIDATGQVDLSKNLVDEVNKVIKNAGFADVLTFDDRPNFVVGKVISKEKHPNADKLSVCQVDIGSETLQIVCGAPNVEEDQHVVVARVGAVMPSGMIIKDAQLRGVASSGMICSARELDLPHAPQKKGILVLDDSKTVGEDFFGK